MDSSLGLSIRDMNSIRQIQRSQNSELSNASLIFASRYAINEERKLLDMIFWSEFECAHDGNEAHVSLEKALYWFVKFDIKDKQKAGESTDKETVYVMTGDGMRIGPMNIHGTYIRPLESQSEKDYLILCSSTGKDTQENFDAMVLWMYKKAEQLDISGIVVEEMLRRIKHYAGADMKEHWMMCHCGDSFTCFWCTCMLRSGSHCGLRPACSHCNESNPGRKYCRHFPDIENVRPVTNFHLVSFPKSISDIDADQLATLAESLEINILRENGKRLIKTDIWNLVSDWIHCNQIVLMTHTKDDTTHILNATEAKIDLNLALRFPDPFNEVMDDKLGHNPTIEDKRALLLECLLLEEHVQYCNKFDGSGVDDIRVLIMDILHCKVRVKNSLLSLLCQTLLSRPNLSQAEKKNRMDKLNAELRKLYVSQLGSPSNINIDVNWATSKVTVTTINGDKLDKLNDEAVQSLLNALYPTEGDKTQVLELFDGKKSKITYNSWKSIFKLFDGIMDTLRIHEKLGQLQFLLLCEKIDDFGNLFIEMFHYDKITNYMHYLISGHVTNMLRRCDYNISNFQQQGCEAMNKSLKRHYSCQTSHGGGNNAVHPCVDTLRCFGRRWLRKIDAYYPGWLDRKRSEITPQQKRDWRSSY